MIRRSVLLLTFATCLGCIPNSDEVVDTSTSKESESLDASPLRITNQFGMTFCLVKIDTDRPDHQDAYPNRSYYLQQTELTYEQFAAYRKFAAGDEQAGAADRYRFPTEWREVANLAGSLSALDPENEYVLPTRAQWSFACMNGYDQTCPGEGARSTIDSTDSLRPNRYGIEGFMNYDAECGDVPGLFLGKLDNWAGAYDDREKPECRCDQFTTGNPDADDGLNELIVARFVLIPTRASQNGG